MLKTSLILAVGLSCLSAPAFSQSVVNDTCMMPKTALLADPYSPLAVQCLSEAEMIKAKAELRNAAKKKPALCAASYTAEISRDPYSSKGVTCRTDAQLSVLVAQLQKPKSATDGTCARPQAFLQKDPYGPLSVSCYAIKTIEAVIKTQKSLTSAETQAQQDRTKLNALYQQVGTVSLRK